MGTEVSSESIAETLKNAISEEVVGTNTTKETGDSTKTAEAAEASGGTTETKTIPYTRFQEVIGQKNDLSGALESAITEKTEALNSVVELNKQLQETQRDRDLLQAIRDLKYDDRTSDAITLIDKALKGELDEIEEDKNLTTEESVEKTRRLLERKTEVLAEEVANSRADQIMQRADMIADSWIGALPEEYNAKDRELVSRIWTDLIDWPEVEADPDILDDTLRTTFEEAINIYDIPRGSLINPNDIELVDDTKTTDTKPPTPEEELAQLVADKNYGGVKAREAGKSGFDPKIHEDDFTADVAKALKIANRARRA